MGVTDSWQVLVTGAGGYLAGAVLPALLEAGHHPVALLHEHGARAGDGGGRSLPAGVPVRFGDLDDPGSLWRAVRGIDAVVHLAALTRVRDSFADPGRYHRVNAAGTRSLLEALAGQCRATGRPVRFVLASSAAVYGAPGPEPLAESAPVDPASPYGESKLAAERAVEGAVEQGAGRVGGAGAAWLGAGVLRIFNAAGALPGRSGGDCTRLVPRVLAVAAGTEAAVRVHGDGSAVRDYVHIRDIASAVPAALRLAEAGTYTVVNIGATAATVLDVVAAARAVTGRAVPVTHLPAVEGEVACLRADTRRARERLGWSPRWSALERLVADEWRAVPAGG